MIKFNFQVPIKESESSDGESEKEFIIEGVAINATTTSNNHKYVEDELKPAAKTLTGVPLLKNHNNDVDSIMGRVKEGKYTVKKVEFSAKVIDKTMQEMIKDGRLDSVSVGASVDRVDEDEDGSYIPRGIVFKELSLVAVGADEGATFGMALSEAYKMTTDTKEKKVIDISKEKADEKAPETVTKEELTDTVAKAVAEALAKEAEARKTAESEKAKAEAIEKEAVEKKKAEEEAEATKLKEAADKKTKEEADLKAKEKAKKEAEEKAAKEAEEDEKDDDETEEKSEHKITEGAGSLRGGALTIERG